jgi:hypothetical protein
VQRLKRPNFWIRSGSRRWACRVLTPAAGEGAAIVGPICSSGPRSATGTHAFTCASALAQTFTVALAPPTAFGQAAHEPN